MATAASISADTSMNPLSETSLKALTEAAAAAVGREVVRLRQLDEIREAKAAAREAELGRQIAEVQGLERDLRERLVSLKDGENGDKGETGDKGDKGDPGERGASGQDVEDITVRQTGPIVEFGFQVGDVRTEFEVELPEGPQGLKGDQGKEGPAGKIESVEPWTDAVHYEGAIRTHAGATWQALADTAKEPPHEDWRCLAERGADGTDGRSFELRETWSAEEDYRQFDVVTLNGGSFAARKDAPGECPGPDWKMLAGAGSRGKMGERGPRGEQGPPGPTVSEIDVDGEGLLTLTNADGSVVTCDLYPLLSRIDGGR